MRRLALLLVVGLLTAGSSGVLDLLAAEPCSITESSSAPSDGACAATCVRCHCTRAVEIAVRLVATDARPLTSEWLPLTSVAPPLVPRDILHVPKAA